ncbi:MAG: SRPBCC family protein [Gammaproteobacteria bacterium]
MDEPTSAIRVPDLSGRRFNLTVERNFPVSATSLYKAWTQRFELWFAAPGSVLMRPEGNAPFFFETEFKFESHSVAQRHPHYGRFLQLVPDQLVQLTWVTGAGGTEGAETVVTVELKANAARTHLRLAHEGFATEAARNQHEHAWPTVLEHLEKRLVQSSAA